MIVKTLKILLIAFVTLITTACNSHPDIKYVDKPYEVKVPVKCIVPEASCNFDKNTSTEVITSMLECIIDMKHNEEKCK